MRTYSSAIVLILGAACGGCGGSAGQPVPLPSHQGVMNELPGKKGYFEIQAQGDSGGGRASRSKPQDRRTILVHFYGTDGTTELTPAPTDVTVKLGVGDSSQAVPLSPQSQGGFASTPGAYPSSFRGRLNAKIGGEPIEATFLIR